MTVRATVPNLAARSAALTIGGAPDRVRSLLLALGRRLLGSAFLLIYAGVAAPAPFRHEGQYKRDKIKVLKCLQSLDTPQ